MFDMESQADNAGRAKGEMQRLLEADDLLQLSFGLPFVSTQVPEPSLMVHLLGRLAESGEADDDALLLQQA